MHARFIVSFFLLTYLLNRPCVYCSILLLVLFVSSCYWSDQCFFDLSANWFEPRPLGAAPRRSHSFQLAGGPGHAVAADAERSDARFVFDVLNDTATALAGAALDELKRRVAHRADWTPDTEWARSWMGSWRIPCLDVNIRL